MSGQPQTPKSGELKLLDPEKRPMNEVELRKIIRKLDYHLMPIVILLYLLAFLDRGNIGNAKILGMVEDAKLTGLKYNIVSAVFFIPYCFGEVPANLCLKLFRPSKWLGSAAIAWGTIVTLMCVCDSFKSLTIARFFVGLAESALAPGILFYLSMWYPRRYLALRVGLYISAIVISGSVGGLLAYGIERMDGVGGRHGWQWIFGLEGIVTVLAGFSALFLTHDSIQSATFLTLSEKDYLQRAITTDSGSDLSAHLNKKFVWQAFTDYRVFLHALCFLGIAIPLYSLALFLPTLVNELGYKAVDAQLFTVPPYTLACVVTLTSAYLSDRLNLRSPFIIINALLGIVGFIILLCSKSSALGYIAMFFACSGVFAANAVYITWFGTTYSGETKRAIAIAIINGVGNLGGICASFAYINPNRYYVGYAVNIACLLVTIILTAFMTWDFNRSNRLKERECEGRDIGVELKAEWQNLGDKSPLFRYPL